jgi:hypothetical protein
LRCAAGIQAGASDIGLTLRAGVHSGEVEVRGDDIAGLAVTIAKRACDLARPGQVLVTRTVTDLVVGAGIALEDSGDRELKGCRTYGACSQSRVDGAARRSRRFVASSTAGIPRSASPDGQHGHSGPWPSSSPRSVPDTQGALQRSLPNPPDPGGPEEGPVGVADKVGPDV